MAFRSPVSASDMDGVGADSVAGAVNSAADQIAALRDTANYNNAWSASQAKIQRDWQEKQNAKAMQFNASEAAKNRDWQQMMSNTAHQREIADLKAAGLNPVLSAMGGNGAAVTSGSTASGVTSSGAKGDTDTSLNSALVNLLGSVYNRTTQLEAANINARTQEAVADKYNATSEIVAQIGAAASRYGSDSSRYASQYASDNAFKSALNVALTGLAGTKYSANSAKEASNYSADSSKAASMYSTDKNYESKRKYGTGTIIDRLPGMTVDAIDELIKLFGG